MLVPRRVARIRSKVEIKWEKRGIGNHHREGKIKTKADDLVELEQKV